MKSLLVAVMTLFVACPPGVAGEENGKIVVTPEMIRQAIEEGRRGKTLPLQMMQRAFGRSDRYVIPKDLLPVYMELLKDRDPRAQRLGISGIVYFKDTRSQAVRGRKLPIADLSLQYTNETNIQFRVWD